ncbi:hypothetical protein [Sporosarcina sp. G11-34]|uniref:hypothetical protein n=1 Tax=Sporosarcina sp. G11-34 TaxID=2849605 RepID=UPI0022A9B21E|nr:hypothetical protein [Sporosarcina sp. G11-34]MCZ2259414.1 hypothetical protein [Sporosarcina sp. G11-34]
MILSFQLNGLVEELGDKKLTENEKDLFEIIKLLVKYREYDTDSALFELKTDVKYFWQRLTHLEEEIRKV